MPEARMRKSMLLRVTAYWLMAMPIPLGLYLWHTPLSVYYAFYAFSLLGWLVPMACGRWWEKDKNLRWQGVLVFTLLWLCGFAVMYGAQRLFWNYEHLLWQTYGPGFCALIAAAQMYLQLFGISAVGQSIWWGVRRVTGWLQAYLILALIVGVLPNAIPICYLCGFYFADSYLTGTVSALASTGGMVLFTLMRDLEVLLAAIAFPLMFIWRQPGSFVTQVIAVVAGLMLYLGARWTYEYILIANGADFLPSVELLRLFLLMMIVDLFLLAASVRLIRLIVLRGPVGDKYR